MKGNIKNILKGKSKLIFAAPIVLIILFTIVLYMDKTSEAKASKSTSPVYMEPPAESEKTVRDKLSAYAIEEKEKEEDKKQSSLTLSESDIFMSSDEKRKNDEKREKQIAQLQEDPYQHAVKQYNLNKELSTHSFASRMTAQLNGLEAQEADRASQREQEKQEMYRKRMEETQEFQKKLYDTYVNPPKEPQVKEETASQPEKAEAEDYALPSIPIYYEDGKRHRRPRVTLPEQRNLVKASVYGNQTIVNGSTVKMRLLEPVFAGGVEIPANTIFHGTAELGPSRLKIKVENIRYGNYITPVHYLIYDMDAIEGLNLPNNLKAEATQRIQQGLVQNIQMPISSIGTMASEVTSAISATTQIAKQVIGQSLSQIKVDLKANYALFLKEETPEDKKRRATEDAELENLYRQLLLQKNEPKKKNYLKKIFDSL